MNIVRIFADRLHSFEYETEDCDEFTRIFRLWHDPEYLDGFFTEHIKDLQNGFYGNITKEDAIITTKIEAKRLEKRLWELAEDPNKSLDEIFRALFELKNDFPERRKAKGDLRDSWLRIYALKLEDGVYIVTGGTIKLTPAMQDREHTNKELLKLNRCIDFLREQGIIDNAGIVEMDI